MKDEPRIVIQKMQDIFRTNQLNRKEIVALLHSGDLDYGDKRFDHAACQISELLLEERVSIEEAIIIFDECYRAELEMGELRVLNYKF
jgi:hypothetical protein